MPWERADDLLQRCARSRDQEAWAEFVGRFRPCLIAGVRRAARRSSVDPASLEVEDLLQEIYCRLLERGGRALLACRGRETREVGAYLGRIAESVTVDHLRAAAALKRGKDRLVKPPEGGHDLADLVPDPGPSPEELVLRAEARRRFLERCRRLAGRSGERDLQIARLAWVEGWTSREIAQRAAGGLSASSVDSVVHRMRRRLAIAGVVVPVR